MLEPRPQDVPVRRRAFGVKVAKAWDHFPEFYEWARTATAKPGLWLVRRDPDGDDSPANDVDHGVVAGSAVQSDGQGADGAAGERNEVRGGVEKEAVRGKEAGEEMNAGTRVAEHITASRSRLGSATGGVVFGRLIPGRASFRTTRIESGSAATIIGLLRRSQPVGVVRGTPRLVAILTSPVSRISSRNLWS
jgi:hypothetical protein